MRIKDMKKKSDPSNPIDLDSGQRKELVYIIESLRKHITEPRKKEAVEGPSESAGERRGHAAVRPAGRFRQHAVTFRRNLPSVA